MELQVGVKVLLENLKGKYLLQRRNPIKYPNAQIGWDVVGGRIQPGISIIENLKREVYEETGLTLIKIDKILAAQDILRIKNKHIIRITYLGSATGKVKLDKEENSEYRWFSFTQIKQLPKNQLDMYFAKVIKELK